MDPITALGAAGSVIGIAGFALQLYQTISKFYTQFTSISEGLGAFLEELGSTASALNHIIDLLQTEKQHERNGKGRLLFSDSALHTIRETADKCLLTFWRIEGTITSKCLDKQFEKDLEKKLVEYHDKVTENSQVEPEINLDESLAAAATPYHVRLKWTLRGVQSKLQAYGEQLHKYQQTFSLMFSIINLHVQQR